MRRLAPRSLLALAAMLIPALPATASAASYYTPDGYIVRVEAPNLPADPARDQSFVNLFGLLVHGSELGTLTVHLAATPAELANSCGSPTASACVTGDTLHTRGWVTAADQRVVLAHEYGHVIHSHRENPPRGAGSDGTKRWASYEGVCQGLKSGEYGEGTYLTTPREAFAQAYATLNFSDAPWNFVASLRPDAGALEAIRQDVLYPWAPTVEAYKGRIKRGRRKLSFDLVLPLDGGLSVKLKAKRRLVAKLVLFIGDTKVKRRVGGPFAAAGGAAARLSYDICGERAALLRVIGSKGRRGKFKLRVERP